MTPFHRRYARPLALIVLAGVTVVLPAFHLARKLAANTGRIRISFTELLVLLAVLFLFALGLGLGFAHALRWLAATLRPSQRWTPRKARAAKVWTGVFCLLCGLVLYARHLEPRWLSVRTQPIALPGLREPLRLVIFSDVHSDNRFDLDGTLAMRINRETPDVLIFLGDALNSPDRAPAFRAALSAMRARYAKLAIRGNWDTWFWDDIDLFGGTGFVELKQGWRDVQAGTNTLRIGAHAFLDDYSPAEVIGQVPPGKSPTLFLYHANDYVPAAARAGVDLYLCGDTHGGQIQIPFWGALFSVGRLGRDFVRGAYREGATQVYVTPGVGVERKLPLRLGVRPEITVLVLGPESTEATGVARSPGRAIKNGAWTIAHAP
jgi:predicted MPP superfamily phosphohydrolase